MEYAFDATLHEIHENGGAYVIFPWDMGHPQGIWKRPSESTCDF